MPYFAIEGQVFMRKRIPPEDVTVQAARRYENGSGESARCELPHSFVHRAPISIIECDRHSWTTIPRFVDPIERHHLGCRGKQVELRGEVALSDKKRTLPSRGGTIRHNAVIRENQTPASNPMPHDSANDRRRQRLLHSLFQESAHVGLSPMSAEAPAHSGPSEHSALPANPV